MPAPSTPPPQTLVSLRDAALRLETESRSLGNIARQHGHCVAVGRETFFSEANLKALAELLKRAAQDRERAAAAARRPKKTFGAHESKEMRKERRRVKKRIPAKEE